jgi:hypothetical protein
MGPFSNKDALLGFSLQAFHAHQQAMRPTVDPKRYGDPETGLPAAGRYLAKKALPAGRASTLKKLMRARCIERGERPVANERLTKRERYAVLKEAMLFKRKKAIKGRGGAR